MGDAPPTEATSVYEAADAGCDLQSLIETAKLNDVDPWLANVLARLPDPPAKRLADLLPWNWPPENLAVEAA